VYRYIVRLKLRRAFARLSEGDAEAVVRQFGPSSRFRFAGTHALGGERRGQEAVRAWFEHVLRLFPGLRLEPRNVIVNGWPWNTVVATHFTVSATLEDGRPYRNEGMQFLRLRWGRVVEDLLLEDTDKLVTELERIGERALPVSESVTAAA
jgi:ketosteroid isomerase-like protein